MQFHKDSRATWLPTGGLVGSAWTLPVPVIRLVNNILGWMIDFWDLPKGEVRAVIALLH